MNEFELKEAISSSLMYADIYDSITSFSIFGFAVAFAVTAVLLLSKYSNFFENNMELDHPFMQHLDFMSKLSSGFLVLFGTLACVFPSESSKLSEADSYISQLADTPQNQAYIYSLSKRYDIKTPEDLHREMLSKAPAAEDVATEVQATSEPVVEKTN